MRHLEAAMHQSLTDSLEHGLFSSKYKVFCRGISSGEQLLHADDATFADEFRKRNSFFLVVDGEDSSSLRLSQYLNTGILSRTTGIIFEKIFAVSPENSPSHKDVIPRYFTISSSGEITAFSETDLNTFKNI